MVKGLFLQVLNMSFTASIVILAVLLLRLPLKRAPKVFSFALLGSSAVSAPLPLFPGKCCEPSSPDPAFPQRNGMDGAACFRYCHYGDRGNGRPRVFSFRIGCQR